jgi:hypothetical protein
MFETQIATWLAARQDAIVAMPRELADSGIDAAGSVVRRFPESGRWRLKHFPKAVTAAP